MTEATALFRIIIPAFGAGLCFGMALFTASEGRAWSTLFEAALTGFQAILVTFAVRAELERQQT